MDWLTFASEIIKAGAWPVVALIVLLVMRQHLTSIVPRLTTLRYKHFEVGLETEMKNIERVAEQAELKSPPSSGRAAERVRENTEVVFPESTKVLITVTAEGSPREAIHRTWDEILFAAWSACLRRGLIPKENEPPYSAPATALREGELIDEATRNLYGRLDSFRRLINTPGYEPSPAIAKRYLDLAIPLWEKLTRL